MKTVMSFKKSKKKFLQIMGRYCDRSSSLETDISSHLQLAPRRTPNTISSPHDLENSPEDPDTISGTHSQNPHLVMTRAASKPRLWRMNAVHREDGTEVNAISLPDLVFDSKSNGNTASMGGDSLRNTRASTESPHLVRGLSKVIK